MSVRDRPATSTPEVDAHAHRALAPADPGFPDAAYTRASAFFRAAGDPERLRTLAQLAGGERCVSQLAETFGVGLSTVSQRLRVLRAEGLVDRRREGKHVYYRLADGHVADVIHNALAHAAEPHHYDHGEDPR